MKNFYDVQQLLKFFGIIVYMKDRSDMLTIVEYEIRELYRMKMIEQGEFLRAIAIIRKEQQEI